MADWQLGTGYDHRFGAVGFHMHRGGKTDARFYVPLSELLKQWKITPEEIRAIMQSQYQWTEGLEDIDSARVRLLEETNWKGKVVLDIGGYDGFAAEIAHKGGAVRAICLDNHQYEHYGWEDKKKEGVEYVQGDFMDAGPKDTPVGTVWRLPATVPEKADTIIFFNVLYHLRNPWAAMDHLRTLLKPDGEMLVCTLFRYSNQPTWHLYEPGECNPTDRTVYWGPSLSGLERLFQFTGWKFEKYALAYDRVLYRCWPIPDFESDLAKEGYAKA